MGMLRFWLALAVAIGHTTSIFGFSWAPNLLGGRAVQMFYVISGFLITLILSGKYSADARGRWIFYTNRAVKIFVPYFAVLAGTIILSLVAYVFTGNAASLAAFFAEAHNMSAGTWAYAIFSNLTLFGLDWGSFLAYRDGSLVWDLHALEQPGAAVGMFSVNNPAWTLSIELTFYLIAPFLVRRHFLALVLSAFALQAIRYHAYHIGWFSYGTDNRFFPFELGLFLYGALLYRANDLLRADVRLQAPIAFGCLALAVVMPDYFRDGYYQFYGLVGLLLPTLFGFSNRHKWDRWLGDFSYPIYVVHYPVAVLLAAFIAHWSPSSIGTNRAYPVLALVLTCLISIVIDRYLVQPVDAWRQRRALATGYQREPASVIALASSTAIPRQASQGIRKSN
jgi:peptidoglycan/LPS O-acetylase OafA/YrhL